MFQLLIAASLLQVAVDAFQPETSQFKEAVADWQTDPFAAKAKYGDVDINDWDVSKVSDFQALIRGDNDNLAVFNSDINGWDTSQVTKMGYTFYYEGTFNQNLNGWDTGKVTEMGWTFAHCIFDKELMAGTRGK
jgi:surface protein